MLFSAKSSHGIFYTQYINFFRRTKIDYSSVNVDVEVWKTPGQNNYNMYDHLIYQSVPDTGEVMPVGRYGWFIPEDHLYDLEDTDFISHSSFLNEDFAQKFMIDNSTFEIFVRPNLE